VILLLVSAVANGPMAMETGGKRYENPSCHVLAPEENYPIVAAYVRRLPAMARPLAYLLAPRRARPGKCTSRAQPAPADGGPSSWRNWYVREDSRTRSGSTLAAGR
jgi:hypothetical protein